MDRLTTLQDWASRYRGGLPPAPRGGALRRILRRVAAVPLFRRWGGSYSDHLFFNVICRRHLPRGSVVRAVEIGSAPGDALVLLHRKFGLDPFGIEYTETGVEVNRRLFASHGIDPSRVIHADFFSESIREGYREFFGVVLSRGFIEHFSNPREVVERHVDLLQEGGVLLVSIPNLRGVNHLLTRLLHPEILQQHNLAIMWREAFSNLFQGLPLTRLRCGYFGTFSFGLFSARPRTVADRIRRLGLLLQVPLNLLFRLFFRDGGAETPAFSPYLLYVGRKTMGGPR